MATLSPGENLCDLIDISSTLPAQERRTLFASLNQAFTDALTFELVAYYSERDVVYEERRMQESSPVGRLFLNWISAAYEAHPYGVGGVIGYSTDLKSITRADAQTFFE